MGSVPQVYTASKLRHAPLWLKLKQEYYGQYEFTSRWIFIAGMVPESPDNAKVFWIRDYEDVKRSTHVLVYAEGEENLRGALVEAGMGIALGKTVIVVGDSREYGSWQFHPSVLRAPDLGRAFWMIDWTHAEV